MKEVYRNWIEVFYPTEKQAYANCLSATQEMVEEFPELRRVRGHYDCPIWGERAHWWCVDPDGSIVDPTAVQFPSRGAFAASYHEAQRKTLVQVGVCMNCGEPIRVTLEAAENGDQGSTFCSDACENRTLAYLNSPSAW